VVDPFDLLWSPVSRYTLPQQPGLPRLLGGAVSYFGYDFGRLREALPATNPAEERGRIHPSQYALPEACGRGASWRDLLDTTLTAFLQVAFRGLAGQGTPVIEFAVAARA
jgi:hypothetical protein